MNLPDLFDTGDEIPPGTPPVDVMGNHAAALHVSGDSLNPDEVSNLFGVTATESETRGIPTVRDDGTEGHVPTAGRWSLGVSKAGADSLNFNEAIEAVLALLPRDLAIWQRVGALGSMHLSVSLSVAFGNGEVWLEPDLLAFLGERRVGLYLEIYQPDPDLAGGQYY